MMFSIGSSTFICAQPASHRQQTILSDTATFKLWSNELVIASHNVISNAKVEGNYDGPLCLFMAL